jgi:hypothetical protein
MVRRLWNLKSRGCAVHYASSVIERRYHAFIQISKLPSQSPSSIQNSKFKIQNSKFKIQNSKFKIQNSKFKIAPHRGAIRPSAR